MSAERRQEADFVAKERCHQGIEPFLCWRLLLWERASRSADQPLLVLRVRGDDREGLELLLRHANAHLERRTSIARDRLDAAANLSTM